MSDLQKPLVHLHGTSASALAEQYRDAGDALYQALTALREAAPNARDYYPLGDEAWKRAVAEHEARLAAVQAAIDEVGDIYAHILNAT